MKKVLFLLFCLSLLSFNSAEAVTLFLDPSSLTIPTSTSFSIDLKVSGLESGIDKAAGAFDVDILYDPSLMLFQSYSLGAFLGDVNSFEAIDGSGLFTAPGLVDLAEVSLFLPSDLLPLQPDTFTLATVNFDCLLSGLSQISIANDANLALGDENGNLLPSTLGSAVTVNQTGGGPAVIPEPSTSLLLAAGLTGAWILRKRIRQK